MQGKTALMIELLCAPLFLCIITIINEKLFVIVDWSAYTLIGVLGIVL